MIEDELFLVVILLFNVGYPQQRYLHLYLFVIVLISVVILAHSFLKATISWRLQVDQIFSPVDKARVQMFSLICAICLINYSVMLSSVLVNNFMFFSCNLQGFIRGYMRMNSWATVKGFYQIAKVYH